MAGITLEVAQAHLDMALNAHLKILQNQEVEVDDHRVLRAQLDAVQADIKYWHGMVTELSPTTSGGGMTVLRGVPR